MILIQPITDWHCLLCGLTDQTREASPHTRFHACPKLGLTAPMVKREIRAKVTVNEREDYVGDEKVQTSAEGRPVMSVTIEREDGQDAVVYAPVATGFGSN